MLFPLLERDFTYDAYERLLDRLAAREAFAVVPLREFLSTRSESQALVGLRHDVDYRLDSALELARLEYERGMRATYFVLHTADYWRQPDLVEKLLRLQDYGHEVGWHNDLVTLECVYAGDARAFLTHELMSLRQAGIRIEGIAAHGSPYCARLGYHNNYFFEDFSNEAKPGLPNVKVVPTKHGPREIRKARLADFGFQYEAYHLDNDLYFSDASFDARGRRWHPNDLNLGALGPGHRAIILIHPCHWDTSIGAKFRRLPASVARAAFPAPPPGART